MDTFAEDELPDSGAVYLLRTPGGRTPDTGADPADSLAEEFVEDEDPAPPSRAAVREGKPQKILDETRRTLAVGMLWLVAAIALLPTLALVLSHWTHFSTEAYRELSLVFTPVVALASAAFGFFFASDERRPF